MSIAEEQLQRCSLSHPDSMQFPYKHQTKAAFSCIQSDKSQLPAVGKFDIFCYF
jgi:hypothetical protein